MPYITIPVRDKGHQISFDDLLYGIDTGAEAFDLWEKNTHDTRTVFRVKTPKRLLDLIDVDRMISLLKKYNEKYARFIDVEDISTNYRSFKIPKRSGGLRQIDAPSEDLMVAQRELKYLLEKEMYASYHTSAYAYIKGRSAIDAVRKHQKNKSRWFLKLDFHNFFGSSTHDFVVAQIKQIFPFSEIYKREDGGRELNKALSLCFLRGGLPQGTPISPMLTNLFMIPIDHALAKMCRESTPHLVYTRYADDMLFSSDLAFEGFLINRIMAHSEILERIKTFHFPAAEATNGKGIKVWKVSKDGVPIIYEMREQPANSIAQSFKRKYPNSLTQTEEIEITYQNRNRLKLNLENMIAEDKPRTKVLSQILSTIESFHAPFTISDHKTRYGSSAGRNWNLGVMLNKDNQITIGHQNKKTFKAMLFSILSDYRKGIIWSAEDAQELGGKIAYYKMVEKNAIEKIIQEYSEKFKLDIFEVLKIAITNRMCG